MPEGMINALLRISPEEKKCQVGVFTYGSTPKARAINLPGQQPLSSSQLVDLRCVRAQIDDFLSCFERNLDLSDTVEIIQPVTRPQPPTCTRTQGIQQMYEILSGTGEAPHSFVSDET